jgi:hypothetical protein
MISSIPEVGPERANDLDRARRDDDDPPPGPVVLVDEGEGLGVGERATTSSTVSSTICSIWSLSQPRVSAASSSRTRSIWSWSAPNSS